MAKTRTRRRTDREQEMRALLSLREAEGLTLRELAAASDVPPGTLAWWSAEIRRRDRAASGEPDFVELVVGGEQERADEGGAVSFEIALRDGVRVRVPARYGLARLVRELSAC